MIAVHEVTRTNPQVHRLLETTFLEAGGYRLTGRDLLAAGVVSGRWAQLEAELAEGLGLVAAAPPSGAEARQELQAFRLAHRLLSADDMRAWLAARGLTMKAVSAFAERMVARRNGGTAGPATTDEQAAALAPEAICSGALLEIGWWLADRILSGATRDPPPRPLPLEDPRVQRLVFAEVRTLAGSTLEEAGVDRGHRLAWIAALDDSHRPWEESVTGERDVARLMREHEFDWCRYELDELRVASPGAAAEAGRQLAEGAVAAELAAAAGGQLVHRRLVLADAPPTLKRLLAGAVAGDVAGPWQEEDAHVVAGVRVRETPNAEDDELRGRARSELLIEASTRLRAGKVRWHERA